MKANEAPEKIYISPLPNHSDGYVGVAWDEPHKTMVEYTRTDAFIEKAIKFFASHIQDNSGGYDRANVIENFRNYMKGE